MTKTSVWSSGAPTPLRRWRDVPVRRELRVDLAVDHQHGAGLAGIIGLEAGL